MTDFKVGDKVICQLVDEAGIQQIKYYNSAQNGKTYITEIIGKMDSAHVLLVTDPKINSWELTNHKAVWGKIDTTKFPIGTRCWSVRSEYLKPAQPRKKSICVVCYKSRLL